MIILFFFLSVFPQQEFSSFDEVILWHMQHKKEMHAFDYYKLVFQSSFGPEHIGNDSLQIFGMLQQEMKEQSTMKTDSAEQLLEPISEDGELVRINLRPFRDAQLSLRSLSRAVYFTAKELQQDTLLFRKQWRNVLQLREDKKITIDDRDLNVINDAFLSKGFIFPMHHSWEYQQANNPSYRVVKRSLFEKLCKKVQ
ncbi:MAG: hypothetical protein FJ218_04180 [Ignavibacteria bacterium]|nr:hypothetical protein [Ignavibacteria bacterium]